MSLETHPTHSPGGAARDDNDFSRLSHGRHPHRGFTIGSYRQPPPMLFTRDGHNAFLGDIYRGHAAFLICSGPSLEKHNLSLLNQRGVLTMSVNNAAAVYRSQLWCSVDEPGNFCDAIWYDPGILKFVPLSQMEKRFRVRSEGGDLLESAQLQLVGDMPAVFGYRRNESFVAEQWLYEDSFNWGNHGQIVDADGNKGGRSVMYVAIRLLFFLGVRRVYLLGCDFRMKEGERNYAFEQDRTASSVRGNNASYDILNARLRRLLPYFEREHFEIYNCTADSGLTVFPQMSFEDALAASTSIMPKSIVTAGMYDRRQHVEEPAAVA